MPARYILAATLLLMTSGAANACCSTDGSSTAEQTNSMTANRMLFFCTNPEEPESTNRMFCGAYMAGFVDAASMAQVTATMKHTCIPDYLSGAEARSIFIRFMKDKAGKHPELGELSFSEVVWFAITEQFPFPCRK